MSTRTWEVLLHPAASDELVWRGFYRQVAEVIVIGAIGPEAKQNRRGFDRAVAAAQGRLDEIEQEGDDA